MAETKKFTFDVSPELRAMMDAHPEVNWTAVFRDAIRRQAKAAEIARQILEEQEDPRVQAVTRSAKARVGDKFREARTAARRTRGR